MKNPSKYLLQIKSSFLLVLLLIQVLIVALTVLVTRLALHNVRESEAEKRKSVALFVGNAFARGSGSVEQAVQVLVANQIYMKQFAEGDRNGLMQSTGGLFNDLNATQSIKQMQFTTPDFKVFLRVHNPTVFGDDVTTSRPSLVQCLTEKHMVAGLEQGLSGYGFRAVAPVVYRQNFIGCAEMGSDLDSHFLERLNRNYAGKWAILNVEESTSLTRAQTVIATLNEPEDSAVRSPAYSLPEEIGRSRSQGETTYEYKKSSEEMVLYVPIRNFKGTIALYVRYVCPTAYYSTVRGMVEQALIISVPGMLLTGLAFWVLYRRIMSPVQALVIETEKIKNFDLDEAVVIEASLVEMEKLIRAIADMKMGLQSFQKYVPSDLVRQIIETHGEARIGGKLKELTVFFSDIENFTNITEDLPPNELAVQLSKYFDQMTNIILKYRGTVDKYIGDSVMAFWGAPIDMEEHALFACRAALQCRLEVERLSQQWKAEGKYEFRTRIGLSTGEMVVGNIGCEQRLNYSVIGDTVNLASRLEGLNKVYKTSILISESTYQSCSQQIEARLIDFVTVKGKVEPVRIYELIGEKGDISPRQKESLKIFSRAIEAYLACEWMGALKLLEEMKLREPEDAVTQLYIERCEGFRACPPEAGWNGCHQYTTK